MEEASRDVRYVRRALTMGCDDKDLVYPIQDLPDGRVLVTRHRPDHTTSLATIRQVADGVPMQPGEEIVTTSRRSDGSREITGSYGLGSPGRGKPAQVATAGYRSGWDRTFNAPGGDA